MRKWRRFHLALKRAIRKGKAGPPELQDFQFRRALWQSFGKDLDTVGREWSTQQLEDVRAIMVAEAAVSNEDSNEDSAGSSGSSASKEQDTEAAFELLRAKAGLGA